MAQKDNRVLLHACCGVCAGYPVSMLKESGYDPVVYFYNPNLDTEEEHNKRLKALSVVCKHFDTELITEEYNHNDFLEYIKGLESEPERGKRCEKCIKLRLKKTAEKAKQLDINKFLSSLPISPHKNYEMIKTYGERYAKDFEIEFLSYNLRKCDGFLKTNKIANELNIYRQNYCGCEFAKSHLM